LLIVIIQNVFTTTAHKATQYFIKPIHSFLLYAPGHTLIYYPFHHFARSLFKADRWVIITCAKLKTSYFSN
jgi:hypothetical protein